MALTAQQQISLIRAYAPILFLHPDERFVPVRPDVFMQQSSLWRGDDTGKKDGWGAGSPNFPNFPRNPLIPRFGISLSPAEDVEGASDPDGDGVNEYYLGHLDPQTQVRPYLRNVQGSRIWLDCAGWRDGDEVTDTSANEACNLDEIARRFGPESTLLQTRYAFFAEVMELDDLERFLVSFAAGPAAAEDLIRGTLGDVWLIWYYFLYPGHEEFLRRCEAFFDKKSDGDYEGDWNAVAVIIPKPFTLPWETPQPMFPPPSHVAYGVRLRGLAEDVADAEKMKQGMTIYRWKEDVEKHDTHPRVYVSRGYHNNYVAAATGNQPPRDPSMLTIEVGKLSCGVGEGASALLDEFKDSVSDIGETIKDVALTLAKVLAGAAIGARFGVPLLGALGGLAAGLAEANASGADHQPSADDWRKKEEEHPPEQGRYGVVITSAEVPDPLKHDPEHPDDPWKNEIAAQVVQWSGDDASRLVNRNTQLWWPPNYEGQWGVQVQNDPMKRRSGIGFPDFRQALLQELLESLAGKKN